MRVALDFRLTFNEYVRTNYWYCWRKCKAPAFLLLIALILTGEVLYSISVASYAPNDMVWLLILLWAIVIWNAVRPYLGSRRFVSSSKGFLDERHFEFSLEGVSLKTATASSSFGWRHIYRVCETRRSFLLFISRYQFLLIPKRCFESDDRMKSFRDLLQQCLPPDVRLS